MKEFVKDFNLLENKEDLFKQKDGYSIPIKTEFIEKSDDIDRSTLFSIQAPFDLLHAEIDDLRFLGKKRKNERKSKRQSKKSKRKNKKMRLQQILSLRKIKYLI